MEQSMNERDKKLQEAIHAKMEELCNMLEEQDTPNHAVLMFYRSDFEDGVTGMMVKGRHGIIVDALATSFQREEQFRHFFEIAYEQSRRNNMKSMMDVLAESILGKEAADKIKDLAQEAADRILKGIKEEEDDDDDDDDDAPHVDIEPVEKYYPEG